MRASPFSLGPTRMISGGSVSLASAEPGVLRRYPTLLSTPSSQYSAISQTQPALATPVQFGGLETTVTRISDANGWAHHYSTWQAFSADQSKVLLGRGSGRVLDVADWSLLRTVSIGMIVCFFDPVDPDIIWGHDGFGAGAARIRKYSYSADDYTTYTIAGYTDVSIGMGEGSISADGRYIVLCAKKSDDDSPWVLVFDTTSETVVGTLNLSGWVYGGTGLDNALISASGDYVIISSYHAGSKGHRIYDRATLTFQRAYTGGSGTDGSNGFTGHCDTGYRSNGDECLVRQRSDGGMVSVRLSDGNEQLELAAAAMSWGNHISCRNTKRPGYAYVSTYYSSDQTAKYIYREICAVKLNGSGQIERFGQGMFPNDGDYDLQAKATSSPYGDMVLFTSGWGTTTPREYVLEVPETMPEPPPVEPDARAVGRGTVYDTGTSITTQSGTSAESGSSFLLLVSWEDGPDISSVTDSKGNTYTLLGSVQNPSGSPNSAQYFCADGEGGAGHTATINFSGNNIYGVAHLIEIVGCTANPLDKHVQGTDGSSPYTVSTGTLAQADEVVVAFFAPQTSANPTNHASSNMDIISAEPNGSSYWASAVGATVVSSTDSFTPSFTGSGLSGTAYLAVMTFKAP